MEKRDPVEPGPGKESERAAKDPVVAPPITLTPRWSRIRLHQVRMEPQEGMSQRRQALQTRQPSPEIVSAPDPALGNPQLPELEPEDDIEVYLASFERVAEACHWPRREWVTRLLPSLTGKAQQAISSLDAREARDYGKVKAAILRGCNISTEMQRLHFRQFRYQEAKGPREVCSRLRELSHRWLKPEIRTKEQIMELLILEQFLTILPEEIQSWVWVRHPETCAQAVSLAEDFQLGQREAGVWEQQVTVRVKVEEVTPEEVETPEALWESPSSQLEPPQPNTTWGSQEEVGRSKYKLPPAPEEETEALQETASARILSRAEERPNLGEQENLDLARTSQGGSGESVARRLEQEEACKRQKRNSAGNERIPPRVFPQLPAQGTLGAIRDLKSQESNIHMVEKPHRCRDCGERFWEKQDLMAHGRVHEKDRPYPCPECGKSFNRLTHLRTHQRTHTGVKPYSCGECGKSFGHLSTLTTHQRLHTGERPYSCAECGKTFTNPSDLNKHQRSHTGERPYPCAECGKRFSQQSNLTMHQRSHTEDRPYPCTECGKSFKYLADLTVHERSHTGERPFPCPECGKSFSNKSSLARHQRIHARAAARNKYGDQLDPVNVENQNQDMLRAPWTSPEAVPASARAWGNPELPELTPEDDIEVYLASFERVAEACHWPRREWVTRLLPFLTGKAQQAISSLNAREARDYGKVKAAILRGCNISTEMQRLHFRQFRYQEAKGPQEVCSRLRELSHRWLKPEIRTKEQIMELLILEQFLTILPEEIQSWIWVRHPETCAQAVSLAEDFQLGQREAGVWEQQVTVHVKVEEMETPEALWESQNSQLEQLQPSHKCLSPEEVGQNKSKLPCAEENQALQETGAGILSRTEKQPCDEGPENLLLPSVPERGSGESVTHKCEQGGACKRQKRSPVHETDPPGECESRFRRLIQLPAPGRPRTIGDHHCQSNFLRTEKPHRCRDCGERFADKQKLTEHGKVHRSERPHPCAECGKSFNRLAHLKTHQRTHTGEKPYFCAECGKRFGHLSTLTTHQRLHTGERPYSCAECGKTFTHPSDLNKHQRSHTGERSYPCVECGKRFSQLSNLTKHQRSHTEERPYPCTECGKSFKYFADLTVHERSHTGERPFPCPECGKSFSNKSSLARHQRIHARAAARNK
ncbi:uncharacterized protein ACDP82_019747 [Pangshura tecta]